MGEVCGLHIRPGFVRTCAPQHDGAGFSQLDAGEMYHPVVPDHDLLYQLAVAQLDLLRLIKEGCNFSTCRPT